MKTLMALKYMVLFVTLAYLTSQGLAQRAPSISPTYSDYVDEKASIMECWRSLYHLRSCYVDLVKVARNGKVRVNILPTCCKAAESINYGCWPKMFPFNPFFPQILESLCSIFSSPPPSNSDIPTPDPQVPIAPVVEGPVSGDAPTPNGEGPVADAPVVQGSTPPSTDADAPSPVDVEGLFADTPSG
ncbi:hypothetical protein L6452_21860 [Arctium lappa]|uniref:Uncharacterized protein n=1 Tax=Arctium lappa TaxID=4217 RepID=A0ACB9AXC6_ARCLA|nr:hypothetical protein L6452_21860 [Arctium lappa]